MCKRLVHQWSEIGNFPPALQARIDQLSEGETKRKLCVNFKNTLKVLKQKNSEEFTL